MHDLTEDFKIDEPLAAKLLEKLQGLDYNYYGRIDLVKLCQDRLPHASHVVILRNLYEVLLHHFAGEIVNMIQSIAQAIEGEDFVEFHPSMREDLIKTILKEALKAYPRSGETVLDHL